jgi:hypothetical protein
MVASVTACMDTHDHLLTLNKLLCLCPPQRLSEKTVLIVAITGPACHRKNHNSVVGVIPIFMSLRRVTSGTPRMQPMMHAATATDMLAKGFVPSPRR